MPDLRGRARQFGRDVPLPCAHAFCLRCIRDWNNSDAGNSDKCPSAVRRFEHYREQVHLYSASHLSGARFRRSRCSRKGDVSSLWSLSGSNFETLRAEMEARRAEMEARRLAAPRAQGATEQQLRVEAAQQQPRVEAARDRRVEMEQARRLAAPSELSFWSNRSSASKRPESGGLRSRQSGSTCACAAQSRLTEALLVEHQRLQARRQEERERARERRTSESEGNRFAAADHHGGRRRPLE